MKRLYAVITAILIVVLLFPSALAGDGRDVVFILTNSASNRAVREIQVERFNNTIGLELGIRIQYSVFGANYDALLEELLSHNRNVDLFTCGDITKAARLIEKGYCVSLEDMPGGQELIDRYPPGSLVRQREVFGDKTYALPFGLNLYAYVINTDLFEKAGLTEDDYPDTWEKARYAARKITEAGRGSFYGYGLSLGEKWTIGSYFLLANSPSTGHAGFNSSAMKFAYSDYSPIARAVRNIIMDGSVIPGYETLDADSLRAHFAEGRIGIMGAASFDCGVYTSQFPAKDHWKIIPAPAISEASPLYPSMATVNDLYLIGQNAQKHRENVMIVYKYLSSDECCAELYEEGLTIPFRQEVYGVSTKEPTLEGYKFFASMDFKPTYPTPEMLLNMTDLYFYDLIEMYWTGRAGENIEQQLAALDERYNAALSKLNAQTLESYRHE